MLPYLVEDKSGGPRNNVAIKESGIVSHLDKVKVMHRYLKFNYTPRSG